MSKDFRHARIERPLATELANQSRRDGWVVLVREGWGHHSILLRTAHRTRLLAEADTFALAQSVFANLAGHLPVEPGRLSAAALEKVEFHV